MYKGVCYMGGAKKPTETGNQSQMKSSWKKTLKEMMFCTILAMAVFFVVKTYIGEGVIVKGESMEGTLNNDDRLITEKITTQFGELERFDIVIFDPHNDKDKYWIKRIIGLPGETVQVIGENIYINGELLEENYGKEPIDEAGLVEEPYTLADDEYFVMGDNRRNSTDSRVIGPVKKADIAGRAFFCLWPLDEFGTITK